MKAISLIFPHQLFEGNVLMAIKNEIYLVEEYLFYTQFKFHQQKIAYHRATMKSYENYLTENNCTINYVESDNKISDVRKLIAELAKQKVTDIHYVDTTDYWLEKRITETATLHNITLTKYDTPYFLNNVAELDAYFDTKKKLYQTDFYIHQRKTRNILIDAKQLPQGGKWTYDADNREKYPKQRTAPTLHFAKQNKYTTEAKAYVQKKYANNYGELSGEVHYPITHKEAKQWLQQFLQTRFADFGIYEDAIVSTETYLHHSLLTPMLNVGLLTPKYIIDETLQFATSNEIPLNSLEGFVRQIIGWREFIRAVYHYKGREERITNFWKFDRKIPHSFYTATTGILPIDDTIKKVVQTGYCHHIERLMILGNFMLLCEFDPNEVYKWFMEMYIDAYDWVMVPNVYGMSQFADGGLMATKPYISGSNYIIKMSDYKKTNTQNGWDAIWDGLFWHFMDKQRKFFLGNPRLGMLVHTFDKMDATKRTNHLLKAQAFLQKLDT